MRDEYYLLNINHSLIHENSMMLWDEWVHMRWMHNTVSPSIDFLTTYIRIKIKWGIQDIPHVSLQFLHEMWCLKKRTQYSFNNTHVDNKIFVARIIPTIQCIWERIPVYHITLKRMYWVRHGQRTCINSIFIPKSKRILMWHNNT